jgi:hypothetical protein
MAEANVRREGTGNPDRRLRSRFSAPSTFDTDSQR